MGRLEGAVLAPFSGFGDYECYPTLAEKAARLAYGIAEAQAYTDGNKRLAWLSALSFLRYNGASLDLREDEAAELIWSVGRKERTYEDLAAAFAATLLTRREND